MVTVGRFINSLLGRIGLRLVRGGGGPWHHPDTKDLQHSYVSPFASYSPWLSDEAFKVALRTVESHTLVDEYRLYELWSLAGQIRNLPGDVLEVGVWKGGSAAILAKAVEGTGKRVWLADTFEGVVKAGPRDTLYRGGEHADAKPTDVAEVMARSMVDDYVMLVGTFPDETGARICSALAFVHIDVDVYESARAIVDFVYPLLSENGIVVFDDYGFYGCEGVTRFVNELYDKPEWLVVHNLNGHAIAMKLASQNR